MVMTGESPARRKCMIDSHAHLTFPELRKQVDDVIARCCEAGVERVITIGVNLEDARSAVELASKFPSRVHAGAAFHPHEAQKVLDADLSAMAEIWDLPSVVALGEMGLDYHYEHAPRADQMRAFEGQLTRAANLDLPIIIHSREAFDDTISVLKNHHMVGRRVVFHCFTGSEEEARRLADCGWRISFTGIVTFNSAKELQGIAKDYPANQIMIETDAPYLSPVPVRGKRPNEPAFVVHTARFLADLRGADFEEFAAQTARNTANFFGL